MRQRLNHDALQPVPCPLCHSTSSAEYEVLYPARLPSSVDESVFSARRRPDKIHYQLVRCHRDQLVRSTPVLPMAALNQLYQQSRFTYQPVVAHLIDSYLSALQPVLAKLSPTAKILEIGCGSGFVLDALHQQGFTQVNGVEPSTEATQFASTRMRPRIKRAPFSKALFPREQFDLICFFQTLDHIPNLNIFLEDCYELLKPGGYLVSLHHNFDTQLRKLLDEKHPIIDIEHTFLFTPETSAAVFEAHGFLTRRVTSSTSTVAVRHLVHLSPLPVVLKNLLMSLLSSISLLNPTLSLKLGNTCIMSQKPFV